MYLRTFIPITKDLQTEQNKITSTNIQDWHDQQAHQFYSWLPLGFKVMKN